jgi:hypothetical protein
MYGEYQGEPVMIVAMDDLSEVGWGAVMVEIEYIEPERPIQIGTRRVVPFRGLSDGLPRPTHGEAPNP